VYFCGESGVGFYGESDKYNINRGTQGTVWIMYTKTFLNRVYKWWDVLYCFFVYTILLQVKIVEYAKKKSCFLDLYQTENNCRAAHINGY